MQLPGEMESSPSSMDEDREPGGGCVKRERTAAEIRKSNKPLMERKRRERINNSLQQLKSILMEVTKKESSYYSKLEKADILEMTVKYLKNMKRQQLAVAMGTDPSILGKYIAGYNECTTEISHYLNTVEGLSPDTRGQLMNHLANSLQRSSLSLAANTAVANLQLSMNQTCSMAPAQPLGIQIPSATPLSGLPGSSNPCMMNQNAPQIQTIPASAMQLVPAKLPSGELVFLLANQQTTNLSPTGGAISILPTIQSNVNNININPNMQSPARLMTAVGVESSELGPETSACTSSTRQGAETQTRSALGQAQFAVPTVSAVSPVLVTPKVLMSPSTSHSTSGASTSDTSHDTSGASTSDISPESDVSGLTSSSRSYRGKRPGRHLADTPLRPVATRPSLGFLRRQSRDTDTDSDSDDDVANNNNIHTYRARNNAPLAREASVIRGPMWRPW